MRRVPCDSCLPIVQLVLIGYCYIHRGFTFNYIASMSQFISLCRLHFQISVTIYFHHCISVQNDLQVIDFNIARRKYLCIARYSQGMHVGHWQVNNKL